MPARQRLFLATGNPHKTREFAELLGPEFEVHDLSSRGDLPVVEETGKTFAENAALKALSASRILKDEHVVADDSGLEVDALCGAPGIFSARYAGTLASDAENVGKLLRELDGMPPARRSARFRCVLALARAGEIIEMFVGNVEGSIALEPNGAGGFGYDPIFIPEGYAITFGELPAAAKNAMSHRARAVAKLREYLQTRADY